MPEFPMAKVTELQQQKFKKVRILGKQYLVFRQGDDAHYVALEFMCKHQNAPLRPEAIQEGVVTCHRHGWQYAMETGACLSAEDVPPLRRYHLKERAGTLYISLGFPSSESG